MLGCQTPNLPSTNPLRPSILHHECVTPVISDISFPELLADYPTGVTVSTEILLTGSKIPSDACALTVTLDSGEKACACEIVGSPDVDENFEGTFKCRPTLACLTHVGILREMHVEVEGLGYALIKVPYHKRFFQVLYYISAIKPDTGSLPGGTEVTIQTSGGFNLEENILEVKFNATVAQCNTLDDTSIRCFSPPSDTLDTGVADIEIKVNGYSSVCLLDDGSACDFVYELGITPVIFDVTPPSIDTVDQTPVTITGENFGTDISKIEVRIGGQKCDVNQLTSNISCTLIGLPAGQNLVEVLVKGIGKAQSDQYIEGISALYDVQPPNGSIYGGTPVSLTGHGFYDNYTFIDIGDYPCNLKENEPNTLSTIVCKTPPANQDGVFQGQITVEQSWDNYAIFPAFDFHYSTLATPYVVSHIPTDGIGGDLLHVQLFLPQPDILQDFGLNFDSNWTMNSKNDWTDVFTITLGGIECPIVNATYPEIPFVDLTCIIGSRLSGHVDGSVNVKGIGNSDNFQFTYNMVLDSVDPTSGNH